MLANDEEEKRLFCVPTHSLRPSFMQTPLYVRGGPNADVCAITLTNELYRSLYEA